VYFCPQEPYTWLGFSLFSFHFSLYPSLMDLAALQAAAAEVAAAPLASAADAEAFKQRFLSKKGVIQGFFEQLRHVPPADKAAVGKALNELKQTAQARYDAAVATLRPTGPTDLPPDLTLPGTPPCTCGSRHPLSHIRNRVLDTFRRIGFTVATGPEIETDWYNFSALNFEVNHPARDMQDTFFIRRASTNSAPEDVLLRTHTSTIQVRVMEADSLPIRILAPGRVYRNEAISARAHCFFHQIEGLVVDRNVSFADLRRTLEYLAHSLFGEVKVRLRPSYFPFTEISAEMDISCTVCGGQGCNLCKHTGWVEILGCGMVDPNVLTNCGIDPNVYSGYAFGMGVERMAQLFYRVPDLRLYAQNDLRFLRQFAAFQV